MLLEDYPVSSLSKLIKIGTIKCAQSLRKDEKISENVCLLFNEMYLQKYEEYFGGKLIRSDENGEFIKELSVLR